MLHTSGLNQILLSLEQEGLIHLHSLGGMSTCTHWEVCPPALTGRYVHPHSLGGMSTRTHWEVCPPALTGRYVHLHSLGGMSTRTHWEVCPPALTGRYVHPHSLGGTCMSTTAHFVYITHYRISNPIIIAIQAPRVETVWSQHIASPVYRLSANCCNITCCVLSSDNDSLKFYSSNYLYLSKLLTRSFLFSHLS